MQKISLLLQKNAILPHWKVRIVDKCFMYQEPTRIIDADSLRNIIRFFNTILSKYPNVKLPIVLNLGQVGFMDKLSYVILECLCYDMITSYGYKVIINFRPDAQIHTAGIASSPLFLLTSRKEEHIAKFISKFKFEIYGNHYRRFLTPEDFTKQELLCNIMDEVAWFQGAFEVDHACREDISEVIVELVGNAKEHGEANCLIDFDIVPATKSSDITQKYFGINIAIVNFSNNLLGTALKEKILKSDTLEERYSDVNRAFVFHSHNFEENYTEEDFFNIATFQHKISGRNGNVYTGGTGLTKLIESLESRSEAHMCYVTSGERSISFKQEYLKYNVAGWLGFNESNDFIASTPDKKIFSKNRFCMPGTAYNLNFIMKRENENADKDSSSV